LWEERRLSYHCVQRQPYNAAAARVHMSGVAVSPVRVPLNWMSASERLQQITNHLSTNYTRGLLNGDVAIITGTLSVWPPALRFSFHVPSFLPRRCAGVKGLFGFPITHLKRGRSHRESVAVRPSSLLRKAQRSSLASKRPDPHLCLHVNLWC